MLDLLPGQSTDSEIAIAIMGCGARGQNFAEWIERHPAEARVVAVAEPDRARRELVANRHRVSAEMRFERWEDLLKRPRLAHLVVNSLMDRLHAPSSVQALQLGYHMLLEKP